MSEEQEKSTSPPELPPPEREPPHHSAEDAERWRERAENAERELVLRRALHGVEWFDPEDAYRELAQHARRDADGNWRIALPPDPRSAARNPKADVALAPAEAARALAARKPHWVRARVLGGSGAGGGEGAHSPSITYAELLKPENHGRLREYLHERPDELERLRQAHFRR